MLKIDLNIKNDDIKIPFKFEVEIGKPHFVETGEPILRDKLFWALCGLDQNNRDVSGTIDGEGICFNASTFNNVLALGDRGMFIRGSVRRNIYKALRTRSNRKIAKQRTDEVINLYKLENLAKMNVKLLEDDELLTVSLARAHYRKIALVIAKLGQDFDENRLSKFSKAYIIVL